jgi:hypothetical protein
MTKVLGIPADEKRDSALVDNLRESYNTITGKDDNQASSEARVADMSKARVDGSINAERDQIARRGKAVPAHLTRAPTDAVVADAGTPSTPVSLLDKRRV